MFSDRAPCTNLHKGVQKDRTKTLAEFPDDILNEYVLMGNRTLTTGLREDYKILRISLFHFTVPNSGILRLTEMKTLSTVISTKWENLARLLNVDNDLVEQTRLKYPDSRSKAVEILKIFNSDPKADIDDLVNALSNLGITVPQNLTAVKNHRTHLLMYKASASSADINSSVPTECSKYEIILSCLHVN